MSPRPEPDAVIRSITAANVPRWTKPQHPMRCAVLGLGNRGKALTRILAGLSGVDIAWLIDVSAERTLAAQALINRFDTKTSRAFDDALADPAVDAVFIAVPDNLHRAIAEKAFNAGKHVFLEKPIATTLDDGKAIVRAWRTSGRMLQIGYVLRFTPFYQAIRNAVRQGRLGPIRVISVSEQLSAAHGASFMRRWHADPRKSGGLAVHKSCHDLDMICWLLDSRPRVVSSFGGSGTFHRPAPARFCSECAIRAECAYADTGLHESRTKAERDNPSAHYLDRCVFGIDKEIVDNQVTAFELENGTRGTYYLAMQGPLRSERRITLIGDNGRLDGILEDGRFQITCVGSGQEPIVWSSRRRKQGGHHGGDATSISRFLNACTGRGPAPILETSDALAGLVFAIAAERSRLGGATSTVGSTDFDVR